MDNTSRQRLFFSSKPDWYVGALVIVKHKKPIHPQVAKQRLMWKEVVALGGEEGRRGGHFFFGSSFACNSGRQIQRSTVAPPLPSPTRDDTNTADRG